MYMESGTSVHNSMYYWYTSARRWLERLGIISFAIASRVVSSTDIYSVNTASDEFTLLEEYLIKSHGHTHHLSFKVLLCPLQRIARR